MVAVSATRQKRMALVATLSKELVMQTARIIDVFFEEEGVTAIEYGLIAALIAVAIIASVTVVGTQLAALYAHVSTAVAAVV